jgi:hypothetical protein
MLSFRVIAQGTKAPASPAKPKKKIYKKVGELKDFMR